MHLLDIYVGEDLRRLANERVSPGEQHTRAWHGARQARRRAIRDTALRWLGDQFVLVGERLRAWSTASEVRVSASRG